MKTKKGKKRNRNASRPPNNGTFLLAVPLLRQAGLHAAVTGGPTLSVPQGENVKVLPSYSKGALENRQQLNEYLSLLFQLEVM